MLGDSHTHTHTQTMISCYSSLACSLGLYFTLFLLSVCLLCMCVVRAREIRYSFHLHLSFSGPLLGGCVYTLVSVTDRRLVPLHVSFMCSVHACVSHVLKYPHASIISFSFSAKSARCASARSCVEVQTTTRISQLSKRALVTFRRQAPRRWTLQSSYSFVPHIRTTGIHT